MGRTGRWTAAVVVVGMALLGALPASGAGVGDADVAYGGGDGVASVTTSVELGRVADVVALADGSTVVLVQAYSTSELVRVDALGGVVAGFGGTVAASLRRLQVAPDGTFWAFGFVDPDPFAPGEAGAVAHFGTDGRPLASFSGDGVAAVEGVEGAGELLLLAGVVLPGGGIYAVGYQGYGYHYGTGVYGQALDASGAPVGPALFQDLNPPGGYYLQATDAVTLRDGRLVMLGAIFGPKNLRSPLAVGFQATGGLDPTFGDAGVVDADLANLGTPTRGTLQADGRVVAVLTGNHPDSELFRSRWVVAADGSTAGVVGAEADVTEGFTAIAARADGRLAVATGDAGTSTPPATSTVLMLDPAGGVEASPSTGAVLATAMVVDAFGGVVVAGDTPSGFDLRRFGSTVPARPTSVNPSRIFDTREATRLQHTGGKPGADGVVHVRVAGYGGVPATGVRAVMLNVTATEATAPGYVTVWPSGQPRPLASSLNLMQAGQTVANLVTVPVGSDGGVELYTQSGTHLLVDVAAWFPAGVGFTPLTPTRILDTRPGVAVNHTGDKPGPDGVVTLHALGERGVPATGVSAVVLTVTATEATEAGYVTVWPSGLPRPLASNLNLRGPDHTVANQVIVPPGADGSVQLYTQSGAHLLADLAGYFTAGSGFTPLAPARVLDTRQPGAINHTGAKPGVDSETTFGVAGLGGVPPTGATAAILNVTATETGAAGYLAIWPSGSARQTASIINATDAGETVANMAIVPIGADGKVVLFSQSGAHLVVDVAGWVS